MRRIPPVTDWAMLCDDDRDFAFYFMRTVEGFYGGSNGMYNRSVVGMWIRGESKGTDLARQVRKNSLHPRPEF